MVDVDDINTDKCSFKTIKVGDRRWHVYQHVVNFLWSKISRNDTYTRIICDILGIEANGPLPPERHQSKYVHNSFTIRTILAQCSKLIGPKKELVTTMFSGLRYDAGFGRIQVRVRRRMKL